MFITPAFAQAATPAPGGGDIIIQLVPFLLIFVIMYFLIIRPQQKRVKEHRDMVAAIRRGDVVVTGGGLIGKVVRVIGDNELRVEIADGVQIRVVKGSVTEVRAKTEPVRERARPEPEDEDEDEAYADDEMIDETPEPRQPKRAAEAASAPARKSGVAPNNGNGRKPAAKATQNKARPRSKPQAAAQASRVAKVPASPAGAQTGEEVAEAANRDAAVKALSDTLDASTEKGGKTADGATKSEA